MPGAVEIVELAKHPSAERGGGSREGNKPHEVPKPVTQRFEVQHSSAIGMVTTADRLRKELSDAHLDK